MLDGSTVAISCVTAHWFAGLVSAQVEVWDWKNGTLNHVFKCCGHRPVSVAALPDGGFVVAGSDGNLRLRGTTVSSTIAGPASAALVDCLTSDDLSGTLTANPFRGWRWGRSTPTGTPLNSVVAAQNGVLVTTDAHGRIMLWSNTEMVRLFTGATSDYTRGTPLAVVGPRVVVAGNNCMQILG